jgi:hypothetical protein
MPGYVLHVGATVQCTHAATASIAPSQTRVVTLSGPAATISDLISVSGCPFQVPIGTGTKPQPCVKVQWLLVSTRVQAGGQPLLLATPGSGGGLCQSAEQIPQGPPVVAVVQQRVFAQ